MSRRDLTMEVIEALGTVQVSDPAALFQAADAVVERLIQIGLLDGEGSPQAGMIEFTGEPLTSEQVSELAARFRGRKLPLDPGSMEFALEFYADPRNYQGTGDGTSYGPHDVGVLVDGGSIARKALGR